MTRKRMFPEYSSSGGSIRKRRRVITRRTYPRKALTQSWSATVASDRTYVTLKYNHFFRLTSGTTTGNNIYSGNSIFDPDVTGVGHQPLGRDQWATLYQYYRVVASKIQVTFVCQNATNPMYCCVVPTTEPTVIDGGNPETYAEYPYGKHSVISIRGGDDKYEVKSYMTTNKMLGVAKFYSGFDEAAPMGTNPNAAARWYWHVLCAGVAGTPDVIVNTTVTYYVELLKRANLTQS